MGTALIRAARLVTIAVVMLAVRSAGAVPSFARQTGFDCTECHTIYPELTPTGRRFKLYGYTWTNKAPEATIVAGRDPTAPPPSTTTPASPVRLWLSRFPPISFVLFASVTAWNRRPVDTDAAGSMYPVQQLSQHLPPPDHDLIRVPRVAAWRAGVPRARRRRRAAASWR